ncbi:hypothetical protein [Quadrisphaera granulorum]|uniref:hypothetical protein n=1 Tax=Quadrisphaera granulorum TaxID=317664 RepID=UPI0011B82FBD|nr:hypothetical protein [Quadrisphaera granulorum]
MKEQPQVPDALQLADGAAVLVGSENRGSVPAVAISGQIVRIGTACWGYANSQGTWVLVVDHGSTVTADGRGVLTPNGVTIRVGDTVFGGAGGGVDQQREDRWRAASPACMEGRGVYPVSATNARGAAGGVVP